MPSRALALATPLLLGLSSLATAGVPLSPTPSAWSNKGHERIAGPFKDEQAYCAARRAGSCDLQPATRGSKSVLSARFVNITPPDNQQNDHHLLVRTSRGWFGRLVDTDGANGYTWTVEKLSITDLVYDAEPEIYVEFSYLKDPCGGCDDAPVWNPRSAMVCTLVAGEPRCTAPIRRGLRDTTPHTDAKGEPTGVGTIAYWTEWRWNRDGSVTRTLKNVEGLTPKEQRKLSGPLRLYFTR